MAKTEPQCSEVPEIWHMWFQSSQGRLPDSEEREQRARGITKKFSKHEALGAWVEMVSGNNLSNINEENKLPGNNQQDCVETSHICPFNRVTEQVDKGEMREVIL